MKLLLFSSTDLTGGAARIAHSLGKSLLKRGHEVRMMVGEKSGSDDWVETISPGWLQASDTAKRWVHWAGLNALHFESQFPASLSSHLLSSYDLVHLHDPPAFNIRHLARLSKQLPVMWTLHTMGAFTGNCLYSMDCDGYREGCGNCPQRDEFPLFHLHRDSSAAILRLRRWFHKRSTVYPVGVSDWITKRARESRVMGQHQIATVRNGIDPERFPIQEREACKRILGVPVGSKAILLSVAGIPEDTRKGLDLALSALRQLGKENYFLIPLGIAGSSSELAQQISELPIPSLPPRHLETDSELSVHYGAADLVWHPSRADTSSLVSMEAMCSGTPVVAASVGGVPEVVKEGEGGFLFAPESPSALLQATRAFFAKKETEREAIGMTAARLVRKEHEIERMTSEYETLYEGAIADHRVRHPKEQK